MTSERSDSTANGGSDADAVADDDETSPAEGQFRRGLDPVARAPFDRTPLLIWAAFAVASVAVRSLFSGSGWALDRWDPLAQGESLAYLAVADDGYSGAPGFVMPGYPLLVRALTWVTGERATTAVLVTYAAAAAASWLFWHWMELRGHDRTVRVWSLLALLSFPYAFVLYGVVGAEAVCLALVLGSFVLLERDQPVLGGLVAAAAITTQVMALAVVPALAVMAWTRWKDSSADGRGGIPAGRSRLDALAPLGLSLLGPVTVSAYLAVTVDDALRPWRGDGAFAGLQLGVFRPTTWLRAGFVLEDAPLSWAANRAAQAVLLYGCALMAYWVYRRYGSMYATFVVGVAALTLVGYGDTASSARRLIVAFPVLVLAGVALARMPRALAATLVGVSGATMFFFYALYVRSIGLPYW